MLRNLILFLFFVGGTGAFAQVADKPVKLPGKKEANPIDYTLMGAPMPQLRIMKYQDTNKLKAALAESLANTPKHKKRKRKHQAEENGIPFAVKDKIMLTDKDFDNGANLFVMMFNPNCSHCEDQTEHLEKNIFLFKKSKIILLANPVMWDYIPGFSKSFRIDEYPAITIGADSADFINKVFLYKPLPQINIYDGQRKLIKTFTGGVLIDSLITYIQ